MALSMPRLRSNHAQTRVRYTAMSGCYSSQPEDGSLPPLTVLFKGEGSRSGDVVSTGRTIAPWAQRGSYRACNVLEYI